MNTNDTLTETTEPSKKFKVIYADPPWDIQQKGARGAAQHYDLMTLDRIKRHARRRSCGRQRDLAALGYQRSTARRP